MQHVAAHVQRIGGSRLAVLCWGQIDHSSRVLIRQIQLAHIDGKRAQLEEGPEGVCPGVSLLGFQQHFVRRSEEAISIHDLAQDDEVERVLALSGEWQCSFHEGSRRVEITERGQGVGREDLRGYDERISAVELS